MFSIHNLTERQVQMIHSALNICAPFGKGADEYHLADHVLQDTGVKCDPALDMFYVNTVVAEWAFVMGVDLATIKKT